MAATRQGGAHVLDEADVRARCAEYLSAFGPGTVAYSAEAGLLPGTRKLEPDLAHPRHLPTEPGMGYRFRP